MIKMKNAYKITRKVKDVYKIKNFDEDSKLGGAFLKLEFMKCHSKGCNIFYDKRVKDFGLEILLRKGYLSWHELIEIINDIRDDYHLNRGEIAKFNITEEKILTKTIVSVTPSIICD